MDKRRAKRLTRARVPQPGRVIVTGCRHHQAIAAKGRVRQSRRVAQRRSQRPAIQRGPDASRAIGPGCSHARAVGAEDRLDDAVAMGKRYRPAIIQVPQQSRSLVGPR